ELFGPVRLAGMALVLLGIAVIVLPRSGGGGAATPHIPPPGHVLPVTGATSAGAGGVVGLIGRVYAYDGFVYEPEVEVPDLFRFDQHYAAPRGAFFVVREDGVVVGSVGVERLQPRRAPGCPVH